MTQELGGLDEDIKYRLGKAKAAFRKLRNIWKSSQLKLKAKLKILKYNVSAVLLYTDAKHGVLLKKMQPSWTYFYKIV